RFSGRWLFVNADVARGSVEIELLDRAGRVIEPFSRSRMRPLGGANGTRLRVAWEGRDTLEELIGEPVRFRFFVNRGRLYSFWVRRSRGGPGGGYAAAGGPGFPHAGDAGAAPMSRAAASSPISAQTWRVFSNDPESD